MPAVSRVLEVVTVKNAEGWVRCRCKITDARGRTFYLRGLKAPNRAAAQARLDAFDFTPGLKQADLDEAVEYVGEHDSLDRWDNTDRDVSLEEVEDYLFSVASDESVERADKVAGWIESLDPAKTNTLARRTGRDELKTVTRAAKVRQARGLLSETGDVVRQARGLLSETGDVVRSASIKGRNRG